MISSHLVQIRMAYDYAMRNHAGQIRKDAAKSPFSSHLLEVALLIEFSGANEEEIVMAWLHDIVEDTSVTIDDIKILFGENIASAIDDLTDPKEFKHLTTETRKKLQAERLIHKNRSVRKVKLADQASNMRAMVLSPPVEWGLQKCIDYILGAELVAKQCKGISGFLDNQFGKALMAAKQVYEIK